ncbi:uncharacterized protein LOC131682421 [Topomyia yanbarensis]|uniref:uncharacterized protein LOC131682421 n=1 Tax=Topomyia yanbarensis TaxID=2498891 RepID=UPI00273AEDF4|nr:uncharacterized protein LOC131682421 [Topomyia yanbarensis]
MELRNLVADMLVKDAVPVRSKFISENCANSVLLIDEVDVFFTKEFYGGAYQPALLIMLPGLDKIQEKIWSLLIENPSLTSESIERSIYDFIDSSDMHERQDFLDFFTREKSYDLLIYEDKDIIRKIKTRPLGYWRNYKLSDRGTILCKDREEYTNDVLCSYYMIFNYFRLRKWNYSVRVASEINYGYLNLGCGSISYAMLPKRYPLILGVTGTLTSLNQHEKTSIRNLYSIHELSAMPSFFGCSNLQFNPETDYQQLANRSKWMNAIFSRANAILGAKRSILVFFENDFQLNQFYTEYSGQFDRLHILTENTDQNQMQQFIDEAGVAKTITLATRGMGRGVDYKSSVSIEKHGGLHVIQTFFSLDIKEEIQIKGRTARKDNRGSYELIVRKADLERVGLPCDVSYCQLDEARLEMALKENKQILKDIVSETENHEATMRYMASFFEA